MRAKFRVAFLSSAAALVAANVSYAADLPSARGVPSSSKVQVCKVAGKSGFAMPGSDTCVFMSGYVFAEALVTGGGSGYLDPKLYSEFYSIPDYRTFLREQIDLDAASNTELGVLNSHLSLRFDQSGQSGGGSGFSYLDDAFVELGGFKAGLFSSTFSMMDGGPSIGVTSDYTGGGRYPAHITPSNSVLQAGYKARISTGLSLGVYVEDNVNFSWGDGQAAKVPDVVATIDLETSYADFHLAGLYHDINAQSVNGNCDPAEEPDYGGGACNGDYNGTGYAFDAGVTFKLDGISKGDTLSIEYTYQHGVGSRLASMADLFDAQILVDTATGYGLSTGSNIGVAYKHVFSERLTSNIFFGYQTVDIADTGWTDFTSTVIGGNFDYQPVMGFHIQPEVFHVSQTNGYVPWGEGGYDIGDGSRTGGVLRIRRDF